MGVLLEYWWVSLIAACSVGLAALWWANRNLCPECGHRRRIKQGVTTLVCSGGQWQATEIRTLRCERGICSDKGIPCNITRPATAQEVRASGT